MGKRKNLSREDILKRKIEKRIKNQSGFLKHAIIYVIFLAFFLVMAMMIRAEEFFVGFGIPIFFWSIGLTIHFASAFLFNRINSWKETRYQQELNRLHLKGSQDQSDFYEEEIEEDEDWDSEFELKEIRKFAEQQERKKWGDGDLV